MRCIFWRGHRDRATPPSIAGAIMSIPSDWLDGLGHWYYAASLGYVRTLLRRVAAIQATVTKALQNRRLTREALAEDDLYARWAAYMCEQGVPRDAAISAGIFAS